jgi:hypothetical protein
MKDLTFVTRIANKASRGSRYVLIHFRIVIDVVGLIGTAVFPNHPYGLQLVYLVLHYNIVLRKVPVRHTAAIIMSVVSAAVTGTTVISSFAQLASVISNAIAKQAASYL